VKDFMREYGKLAAVTAAGAFLISLVVGLASGNPFGVALGRALVFALLFAGLAAGARYIVAKYLPELVGSTPPESASGQKIDITLPEEGPIAPLRAGAYAPASGQPVHAVQSEPDLATEEIGVSGSADATPAPDLERPGSGEMPDFAGDSFDDELPPLTDDGAIAENEIGLASDSVEEAESVPEDGSASRAEETDDPFQADAELGRLPDISSLGGSVSGTRTSPPRKTQ
jgi:hypothetical protein